MSVRTAFAATGRVNLYPMESSESLDNGRTWSVSGTLVPVPAKLYCVPKQSALDRLRRQHVHTHCGFCRSSDGRTWGRTVTSPFDATDATAVDAAASDRVVAFDAGELFESIDAGAPWRAVDTTVGVRRTRSDGPERTQTDDPGQ